MSKCTPKVESSKFDQSVCLLYHKEAVYNFIGRMDSPKSKNQLLKSFSLDLSVKFSLFGEPTMIGMGFCRKPIENHECPAYHGRIRGVMRKFCMKMT